METAKTFVHTVGGMDIGLHTHTHMHAHPFRGTYMLIKLNRIKPNEIIKKIHKYTNTYDLANKQTNKQMQVQKERVTTTNQYSIRMQIFGISII